MRIGYPLIVSILPAAHLNFMKNRINRMVVGFVAMAALSGSFFLVGCAHEISKEKKTTVGRDGSVKTQERTVTEQPDGTVTRKDEYKKVSP